jgi:fibronectin-binding autotransporter adhesin
VQSGGTAAPGLLQPFSTLGINGNVSFASGSVFIVNVNPLGQKDALLATGAATLSGGTVQILAGTGTYSPSSRYDILTATGGLTGRFDKLETSSNLAEAFAFLTPSLIYDPNDVLLGFTQTASFQSAATTHNQFSTATALQGLPASNPLYNAVIGQSVAGAGQAFDALSGEVHASAVTAAFEDSRQPREAILDRLSGPPDTPPLVASAAPTAGYTASLPAGVFPEPGAGDAQTVQPTLSGFWSQGFGDWGHNRSDGNAAALSRATGGFIIGADALVAQSAGLWRFGAAGGYTDDSIAVGSRQSSGTFQSVFGAIYGGASLGAVQLRAGAIYGANITTTSRQITFPGFGDVVTSNYGGSTAQAFGEAGYRFGVGGFGLREAWLEPFLGGAAIRVRQNGFAEGGGVAGLSGFGQSDDLATTTAGLRAEATVGGALPLTVRALVGWRHAYGDVSPAAVMAFQGASQTFTIAGAPIGRDAAVVEGGLGLAITKTATLSVSYSGQFGQRATDNAFHGRLDVSF